MGVSLRVNGAPPFDGFTNLFEGRRAEMLAEASAQERQRIADAEATRYLAEMVCPPDVVDFGRRHGIPTFAEVTWQAGFMAGWRAAQTRKADGTPEGERGGA